MNLVGIYGPTMTMVDVCSVLKTNRCSIYCWTKESHPGYKPDFPKPLKEFRKKLFLTVAFESYIIGMSYPNL